MITFEEMALEMKQVAEADLFDPLVHAKNLAEHPEIPAELPDKYYRYIIWQGEEIKLALTKSVIPIMGTRLPLETDIGNAYLWTFSIGAIKDEVLPEEFVQKMRAIFLPIDNSVGTFTKQIEQPSIVRPGVTRIFGSITLKR